MEWLEVSVTTGYEAAEAVADLLSRYAYRGVAIETGPQGWEEEQVIVKAYLPADELPFAHRQRIEEALGHLNQILPVSAPVFRTIAEQDWAEAWKERLTVMHIGRRIVVCPSWLTYEPAPDEVVIRLDPGMAFGSGLHPSTRLCLMKLEELVRPGARVLDMGTGSGILAIAAARLGAGQVLAVDNDPVAVRVARENVAANGVRELVRVVRGSLAEAQGEYDVIVVNILVNVIVEMIQGGLADRVLPGGAFIAAGLILGQEGEVSTALAQKGLLVVEKDQIEDWVCLVAKSRDVFPDKG
ncbi:MAG: 50S ribosomal protein L11 methyltransferase [Anaerolineae bacterium]|nr:50S ribosomal protein L11 methyltransferase [Anaerolineae bacterium]